MTFKAGQYGNVAIVTGDVPLTRDELEMLGQSRLDSLFARLQKDGATAISDRIVLVPPCDPWTGGMCDGLSGGRFHYHLGFKAKFS